MNIFYLHEDPHLAASYVYDKHKVKMILESAQMLCTAHRYYGNENVPYKTAHLNHPSSIWVRENTHHYYWLYEHMLALGNEYTKRYNKTHLSDEIIVFLESILPQCSPPRKLKIIAPYKYKADFAITTASTFAIEIVAANAMNGKLPKYPKTFAVIVRYFSS